MSSDTKKTQFIQKKRSKTKLKTGKIPKKLNITEENKTGPWDESEDERLSNWVAKNGASNWARCAKKVKTRTGKQCREHWINKFNENIKKGNWTPEEDLLILKFYSKFQSWKKIIPIFENRTENSIKNRFFSILRKIAIKKEKYGNTDMSTKIGLDKLKQFLDEAIEEAENIYFNENKEQTKEQFENYINEIENNLKYLRKGNFLDLNSLRKKDFNGIDNNSLIFIKKDNRKDNKNYNSDSISFSEDEDEDGKKSDIKIAGNIEKKKSYIKKISKEKNSNEFLRDDSKEKQSNQNNELLKKKSNCKIKNDNNAFEIPFYQSEIIHNGISSESIKMTSKNSFFSNPSHNNSENDPNKFHSNTTTEIKNAKKGTMLFPVLHSLESEKIECLFNI